MIAAVAASSPVAVLATPRRARRALVVVHPPMIIYLTSVCWTGLGVYPADPHAALDVSCAIALGVTQLVLGLRIASRQAGTERFAMWALVVVLAIIPAVNHADVRWGVVAWFPAAAGGMVFAGWRRAAAFAAPVVTGLAWYEAHIQEPNTAYHAYYIGYILALFFLGGGCLVAATPVVQMGTRLSPARPRPADLAP